MAHTTQRERLCCAALPVDGCWVWGPRDTGVVVGGRLSLGSQPTTVAGFFLNAFRSGGRGAGCPSSASRGGRVANLVEPPACVCVGCLAGSEFACRRMSRAPLRSTEDSAMQLKAEYWGRGQKNAGGAQALVMYGVHPAVASTPPWPSPPILEWFPLEWLSLAQHDWKGPQIWRSAIDQRPGKRP